MVSGGVSARFDDLVDRHVPLSLHDPYRVLATDRTGEVRDVIERAEAESLAGAWVAGFVAYEAAPAFDDALVVRAPRPDLPLAWFSAFRSAGHRPGSAGRPVPDGSLASGDLRRRVRGGRDRHPGVDHHRRHLSGQLHVAATGERGGGSGVRLRSTCSGRNGAVIMH